MTSLFPGNTKVFLAFLWLVFVSFLFCLPGAAFPSADWMSRIYFDKWVHIGIFTGILFFWSWALQLLKRNSLLILFIVALLYGLLVEIVQDQFIPNRSFDWKDWVADLVGSIIGLLFWLYMVKKKKPL